MAAGLAPGSAAAYCANGPDPDEQVHETFQRTTDHFRPPRPHLHDRARRSNVPLVITGPSQPAPRKRQTTAQAGLDSN